MTPVGDISGKHSPQSAGRKRCLLTWDAQQLLDLHKGWYRDPAPHNAGWRTCLFATLYTLTRWLSQPLAWALGQPGFPAQV